MDHLYEDIWNRLIDILDFKSIIRLVQVNHNLNKMTSKHIYYEELSRLKKSDKKHKFGSINIVKQYFIFHMINIIRIHKFDHPRAIQICIEYRYTDLIYLIHTSSSPDFKWSKFILRKEFANIISQTNVSNQMLDVLYEINPDTTIRGVCTSYVWGQKLQWILKNIPEQIKNLNFAGIVYEVFTFADPDLFRQFIEISKKYYYEFSCSLNYDEIYEKIKNGDQTKYQELIELLFRNFSNRVLIQWYSICKYNLIWIMDKWIDIVGRFEERDIIELVNGAISYGNISILEWLESHLIKVDYKLFEKNPQTDINYKSLPILEWIKSNKNLLILVDNKNICPIKIPRQYDILEGQVTHPEKCGDTVPLIKWYLGNNHRDINIKLICHAIIFHGATIISWLHENILQFWNHKMLNNMIYEIIKFIILQNIDSGCMIKIFIKLKELGYNINILNNLVDYILLIGKPEIFRWFYENNCLEGDITKYDISNLIINGNYNSIKYLEFMNIKISANDIEEYGFNYGLTGAQLENIYNFYENNDRIFSLNRITKQILKIMIELHKSGRKVFKEKYGQLSKIMKRNYAVDGAKLNKIDKMLDKYGLNYFDYLGGPFFQGPSPVWEYITYCKKEICAK